jgi:hypothetical protein
VFQSASTATSFGFVYVFALSFMASFLMSNLLDQQSPAAIWLELIPAFALYRGLYEMSGYAFYANYQGSVGLTFGKFSDDANGMPEILAIMIVEFFVFMALAWYLEQVRPPVSHLFRAVVALYCLRVMSLRVIFTSCLFVTSSCHFHCGFLPAVGFFVCS